jgi:hypothetical protein
MIKGYVDAFIIACPTPADGLPAFRDYVENLLAWRDAMSLGGASIHISNRVYELLASTGHYPLWDPIVKSLTALGLADVQPKDVVDVVHGLMMRAQQLEDVIGLSELLFEPTCCALPFPEGARSEPFIEHLCYLTVAMGIYELQCAEKGSGRHRLLSKHAANDAVVMLDGSVIDAEGARRDEFNWPLQLQSVFPVVTHPSNIYSGIDLGEMFLESLSSNNERLLISIIGETLRRYEVDESLKQDEWSIGRSFFKTISGLTGLRTANNGRAFLRACVETICNQHLGAVHSIRVSKGGNAVQLRRASDDANAWRRDIDHEFHLHYWGTTRGPEFASVVAHKDLTIPA